MSKCYPRNSRAELLALARILREHFIKTGGHPGIIDTISRVIERAEGKR